jgi:hypothetical protein
MRETSTFISKEFGISRFEIMGLWDYGIIGKSIAL